MIALAVAWALSVLMLGADPSPLDGASRTTLALSIWLALAGLPRGAERGGTTSTGARAIHGPALTVALMAAPLALAWRLDGAAGVAVPWTAIAYGVALVATLRLAADVAAARPRSAARYAATWIAVVVGAPTLAAVLAGGGGEAPVGIRHAAGASPLAWALERVGEPAGPPPWVPLGVALLLVAVGLGPEPEGDA